VRKIAATRCAENGATVPQMNAIFGWTGERMALHYIEAAKQEDGRRCNAQADERKSNFYCRTQGQGATISGKRSIKSTSNIFCGGPGRTRTSNQTVMSEVPKQDDSEKSTT
jgi:hypothetical protein